MKQKLLSLFIFFSLNGFAQTPELIFHSGFEPQSTVIFSDSDIIGRDNSVSPPNNWITDLEWHPNIGEFYFYYEAGDSTMRFARIVEDPTNPGNQILHYWLNQANAPGGKGRIQAEIYGNNNLVELSQKVRLYLPSDWNIIKNAEDLTITFLTIMEFWNNAGWTGEDYPFRITMSIRKNNPDSSELTFNISADTKSDGIWQTFWNESDTSFSIPVEQWMTLEFYFKEGNASNGKFSLAVTPDGEAKQILFDITNFTHHPSDASPDGLTDYNPMKLYTSSSVINYVRNNGGVLQVYWDDFEIWKDTNLVLNVPESQTASTYKLFPNPMKESAILEFNNNTNESHILKLYNSLGQLVKTISDIETGRVVISNENLTNGVYVFQLSADNKTKLTGKLIVY